ncbi:hypothetical protein [Robiginitalea marina]|uniref:Uncharacterized protein n=1 Tax=Robiginitalea marina TaxID=2954105 RepID=A0ABT1AZF9_9FLAO|nr:hypothetical protein [Robiginitalea marina]MCO5724955.1 hypothetical protein [Robiginitalea marina]
MKISAMAWVVFTTFFLIALTIGAAMDLAFHWIFYATVLGQGMVVMMVYQVLTDTYQTSRTFEDFYEDRPITRQ